MLDAPEAHGRRDIAREWMLGWASLFAHEQNERLDVQRAEWRTMQDQANARARRAEERNRRRMARQGALDDVLPRGQLETDWSPDTVPGGPTALGAGNPSRLQANELRGGGRAVSHSTCHVCTTLAAAEPRCGTVSVPGQV